MPKKLRKQKVCLNCETEIGDSNYCPECGQINSHKQVPLTHFFEDVIGDYLTFDSRFFKSFVPLISKPGHLTNEYNQGKRNRYIFPLRLYVFATILFFFIITVQSKINSKSLEQLKQESTPITIDSISQIIAKQDSTIETYTLNNIALDLKSKFIINAKVDENEGILIDSLSNIISKLDSNILVKDRKEVGNQLKRYFRFSKKKKNQAKNLDSLRQFLNHFSFLKDTIKDQFKDQIDSLFRVRIRNLNKTGNVVFTTGNDTLEPGLLKDFVDYMQVKGQYLNSKGDQGLELILAEFINQIPKVMFLILPLFALILKLLYVRKKILYINHLIFTLHLHTVIFIYLLLAILFQNSYVTLIVIIAIWFYMFFGFKNVYKQSIIMTFLKLNTLLILYFWPLLGGFIAMAILALVTV